MERRLAAILAADVVGYSRLIRADEEGTIAALKALRAELIDPTLTEHNGRVVKLMGDGMLAEFPSVVDAVFTAVEVQNAMAARAKDTAKEKRIEFRVGINLGDVVIDGDDIHGDGVNLAARLEGLAEPGGLCVADNVYDQIRDRTNFEFDDQGEQAVKNFDRPIRVWGWHPERTVERTKPSVIDDALRLPDRPSIAVLPFDNMSGDPEQEYFANGIAEDIITALSRVEWFFVTARNSSFTYKGRAVDVQQIGQDLGVRYVLEGSVRRSGQRLRITAQLIDAISGSHVWAERYDRELSDIFDVQDEITRNVVASTQTQIQLSEGSLFRELEKPSLPVWALINRSWKLMYEMTADSLPEAVRLAEEAVSLDPGSGRAHQALASALFHWFWMGFVDDGEPVVSRGRNMAERAVRLNANDEYSHWILGMFKLLDGEFDKAISEMERAIEVNPNCSLAYGSLATVLNYAGDPERSVANNEIAIRSNPRDPSIFYRYTGLALSHYLLNQLDSAIEWARKSTQFKPEFFQGYAVLIASLIEKDCPEEAQSALQDCLQHSPKAALSEVAKLPFRHSSHRQRLTDALREAGLPE